MVILKKVPLALCEYFCVFTCSVRLHFPKIGCSKNYNCKPVQCWVVRQREVDFSKFSFRVLKRNKRQINRRQRNKNKSFNENQYNAKEKWAK